MGIISIQLLRKAQTRWRKAEPFFWRCSPSPQWRGQVWGGPGAAVSAISSAGLAAVITIHYRSPLPPKGAGAAPPSQPSLLLPFTLNYLPYYTAAWRETKSQGSGQAGSRQRAGGQRAAGRQAQLGRK